MRPLLLCLVLLSAGFAGTPAGAPPPAGDSPRIVAIGDVHGASEAFAAILAKAGLIDGEKKWIGGNAILVQTGDMTDRGAGMKEALDLLMSLEQQARKAGGRVHAILGNHEVMNLTGEMRDVTPEIFATFGGAAAMREAFSPKGTYGKWLRTKPIVAEIDGTIFMHAGINPEYTKDSVDELNRRVRRELQQWDAGVKLLEQRKLVPRAPTLMQATDAARREIARINAAAAEGTAPPDALEVGTTLLPVANIITSPLFAEQGPLWFRGFNTWPDAEGSTRMAALLQKLGARRFVTGHSVQPDGRITQRFGGSLFLIDTGMLGGRFFPGGRPSALVFDAGSPRPLYLH